MATDRELYEEMYARQLAEGATLEQAMRSNRASTPEDYLRAFGNSDDPHQQWRKIGGGNKMGSAGAAVNAARRARAEARRSAPDPNVNNYTNKNLADYLGLGRFFSKIDAQVNDTQGKNMPSNPSFGFSQKTLNAANDGEGARGADSSFAGEAGRNVYGGDMRSDSVSNRVNGFLSGMTLGYQPSVHSHSLDGSLLAGGPDPNRGLNRGATYGRDGEKTSITTDSKFGLKMREAMKNWSMSDIQA